MKILLAGAGRSRMREVAEEYGVPYVMSSYYYMRHSPTSGSGADWKLDYRDHENCRGLMLDSGAFSYIGGESSQDAADVDWYEYADAYTDFVIENDIQRWVELDLDNVISYDFALELREYMEDKVGRQCIPVWHRSRGKQAFFDTAEEYDLIAMGGFPWDEISPSEYHFLPKFINEAHKRGARVHGLGFQPRTETLDKYPFDSTDSSNWRYATYGIMWTFNGIELQRIEHDKEVIDDHYRHNVREWSKFARYMDGRNEPAIGTEW